MFDLWIRLMENSAVMSVAILVMLAAVRFMRRRVSARVRFACWVFVAVGLLLPVRFTLFTVEVPDWGLASSGANFNAEATRPAPGTLDIAYAEGGALLHIGGYVAEGYELGATTYVYEATQMTSALYIPQAQARVWDVPRILFSIWAAGALAVLVLHSVRHWLFVHSVRRWSRPCAEVSVNALLLSVCAEVGTRVPQIKICPLTATPMVLGVFRPVLLLPEGMGAAPQLRLMLLHEVVHIKRGDNAMRLLALAAGVVHWFNPLVYLMKRAMHTEAELACDAAVLRHAGDDARMAYGQAVVDTARRVHNRVQWSVLASALSGEGKNLKRRLAGIIENKRSRRGLAIFFAVLMIGGVLVAGMISYEPRTTPTQGDNFVEDIGWQGDDVALDTSDAADTADTAEPITPVVDADGEPLLPHEANPITLEPTNQLIIYLPAGNLSTFSRLSDAVDVFRRRYPDVEVIVEFIGNTYDYGALFFQQYPQRVSAEMMAGGGPCIILTHVFEDIHKTMDSGAFLNLSPFWHRDADFAARDQVNHVIMDAGVHRGRRYVVPISFYLKLYLGERHMLEAMGFDFDHGGTPTAFLNAVQQVIPAAQQNPLFVRALGRTYQHMMNNLFPQLPLVDFERGEVLPYEEVVRAFSQAFAPFYGDTTDLYTLMMQYRTERMKRYGRMLFHSYWVASQEILFGYSALLSHSPLGVDPLYMPYIVPGRNHHGEIHASVAQSLAINANTPNYVNAWRFIRFMLTELRQYSTQGTVGFWGLGGGMPVNTIALTRQLNGIVATHGIIGTVEGIVTQRALTHAEREGLNNIFLGIESAVLPNRAVSVIYREIMTPFFRGEVSLDDAMENLRRRLQLYLTE